MNIVIEPREPDCIDAPGVDAGSPAPAARCADGNGTLTALFFSDDVIDIARAKAMCRRCPLQASCLADALERAEPWGVWGGELLSGGRIVANKRPCGRPPKRPRPALIVDELGPVIPRDAGLADVAKHGVDLLEVPDARSAAAVGQATAAAAAHGVDGGE